VIFRTLYLGRLSAPAENLAKITVQTIGDANKPHFYLIFQTKQPLLRRGCAAC
jgi:hypothetical protein